MRDEGDRNEKGKQEMELNKERGKRGNEGKHQEEQDERGEQSSPFSSSSYLRGREHTGTPPLPARLQVRGGGKGSEREGERKGEREEEKRKRRKF